MLSTNQITPRKIKVMLVDDSTILLRDAVPFLYEHPSINVVGSVYITKNAVAQAQLHNPDVVLVDITTGGVGGMVVIRELHAACPTVHIIVLDEIEHEPVKHAAIRSGAAAFVGKMTVKTDLVPAILALADSPAINARPDVEKMSFETHL